MCNFGRFVAILFAGMMTTAAIAGDAISIDNHGTVTVPGTLRAGAVQAVNLDKSLADILKEVKSLTTELKSVKAEVTSLRQQLSDKTTDESWFVYASNLRSAFEKYNDSDGKAYEFAIMSNSDFRKVTFSTWDGGYRLTTTPYMTGDKEPYQLGGTTFLYGATPVTTSVPPTGLSVTLLVSDLCSQRGRMFGGKDTGVYQLYYFYDKDGANTGWGNGCGDGGTLYARKRLFQ